MLTNCQSLLDESPFLLTLRLRGPAEEDAGGVRGYCIRPLQQPSQAKEIEDAILVHLIQTLASQERERKQNKQCGRALHQPRIGEPIVLHGMGRSILDRWPTSRKNGATR